MATAEQVHAIVHEVSNRLVHECIKAYGRADGNLWGPKCTAAALTEAGTACAAHGMLYLTRIAITRRCKHYNEHPEAILQAVSGNMAACALWQQ
jgi:hypothetical protein